MAAESSEAAFPEGATPPPAAIALPAAAGEAAGTTFRVLLALSLSHGLNDILQALLPALYPLLKTSYALSFTQIGLITFVFQLASSLFQPLVGHYTDRRPMPYSLAAGMAATLGGIVLLSRAASFPAIATAAALLGSGSAVFHPEASRLARLASGGRHGLAQSIFQVGGNFGTSLGPLLAAWVVMPYGQGNVAWFSLVALCGIAVLTGVGTWYRNHLSELRRRPRATTTPKSPLSPRKATVAIAVLLALIFGKFFYLACLNNYYTFYLITRFGVSVQHAQVLLFVLLGSFALGTLLGGHAGDLWGRRRVIWISILGPAPFALLLPNVGLVACILLSVMIGLLLASGFPAILVYAQDLLPGRVGTVGGLFFGAAFGLAGIGSAVLGRLADHTSIPFVFEVCAWLPLIGLCTAFLPDIEGHKRRPRRAD